MTETETEREKRETHSIFYLLIMTQGLYINPEMTFILDKCQKPYCYGQTDKISYRTDHLTGVMKKKNILNGTVKNN